MCLSTVFVESDGKRQKVMQDVAHMEAENNGYVMFDLFGVDKFVQGKIKRLDFVDDHEVLLEKIV